MALGVTQMGDLPPGYRQGKRGGKRKTGVRKSYRG